MAATPRSGRSIDAAGFPPASSREHVVKIATTPRSCGSTAGATPRSCGSTTGAAGVASTRESSVSNSGAAPSVRNRVHRTNLPLADINAQLRTVPPTAGFAGFLRLSRGVIGQTFGEYCLTSQEMVKRPECDAMTPEAFTTPRSVRAAGRVVLHGKGPRMDLQDLYTRQDREDALKVVMKARDKALHLMERGDQNLKTVNPSYNPGDAPRKQRIVPSTLDPAGATSVSKQLDTIRMEQYDRERRRAFRENDTLCAIIR